MKLNLPVNFQKRERERMVGKKVESLKNTHFCRGERKLVLGDKNLKKIEEKTCLKAKQT